jgi:hypothetical protein
MVSSTRTPSWARSRRQVLLAPDHDLGDPDLAGLVQRSDEQAIRLLGPVLRQQVVSLAEVDRVDLVERDEVADVDRVRELDVEPVEIFVLDRDVPALLDLEPANDLVGRNRFAAVLADLLVADRRQVAAVEEVEAEFLGLGRRVHAHGHADEAERDRPAPDRSHGRVIPAVAVEKPLLADGHCVRRGDGKDAE